MITDRTLGILAGAITGVIIGILVLIIILKVTKTDGNIKCKYDERQELVRGKGFKYAFFTLLCYNFIAACLIMDFEEIPIDGSGYLMIGTIIGVLVYVTYAIWNEAYISLNENPKKIMLVFALLGFSNLLLGIRQMIEGKFLENGVLTFHSMNFFIGIVMVIIFAVLVAKQICRRREED